MKKEEKTDNSAQAIPLSWGLTVFVDGIDSNRLKNYNVLVVAICAYGAFLYGIYTVSSVCFFFSEFVFIYFCITTTLKLSICLGCLCFFIVSLRNLIAGNTSNWKMISINDSKSKVNFFKMKRKKIIIKNCVIKIDLSEKILLLKKKIPQFLSNSKNCSRRIISTSHHRTKKIYFDYKFFSGSKLNEVQCNRI